jgi:hypothetical protein
MPLAEVHRVDERAIQADHAKWRCLHPPTVPCQLQRKREKASTMPSGTAFGIRFVAVLLVSLPLALPARSQGDQKVAVYLTVDCSDEACADRIQSHIVDAIKSNAKFSTTRNAEEASVIMSVSAVKVQTAGDKQLDKQLLGYAIAYLVKREGSTTFKNTFVPVEVFDAKLRGEVLSRLGV